MSDKIEFFGKVDRQGFKEDGKITSAEPAWRHRRRIDLLREEIGEDEIRLRNGRELGLLDGPQERRLVQEVRKKSERLDDLEASRPQLSGKQVDETAKLYEDLGPLIGGSLFTRDDAKKGLCDCHEELRRQKSACLELPMTESRMEVLHGMNIQYQKSGPGVVKVSRDEATKIYRIAGAYLGEDTNVERLRKSHKYGTYKSDRPLEEVIAEGFAKLAERK